MTHPVQQISVLVVGGGLIGLSTALFLQQHGTPFILVEREQDVSPLPRARGWAVRSMELFRSLGLEDAIENAAEQAWEQGVFGGARRGVTMLSSEELAIPDTVAMTGNDPSPCKMAACPQTSVEPILRRALKERGGDVRYGCELLRFEQDVDRVLATVKDASGAERTIQAAYMVAADGSRGSVRRSLNIDREGSGRARHYLNIFFEADLAERIRDRTFSQCEVRNDRVEGVFLSMNNTTHWSFHLRYDPDADQPEGWSDTKVKELLHAAIGEDIPLRVLHRGAWTAVDRVARRFRDGRIFLVGDAAHIMPPWGGLNGNTGIADAHNLAWKLGAAVRGDAEPELLDSYERERRPVALRNAEQAQLRNDYDLRFGIRTQANAEVFDRLRDGGELLMRPRYTSGDTVETLCGQEGTRFPHAWIEQDGERRSTLDLFGLGVTTLGGPTAEDESALRVGKNFRFVDEGVSWQTLVHEDDSATIQVRPDGFVTSRRRDR